MQRKVMRFQTHAILNTKRQRVIVVKDFPSGLQLIPSFYCLKQFKNKLSLYSLILLIRNYHILTY